MRSLTVKWTLALLFVLAAAGPGLASGGAAATVSAEDALRRLQEGNARYVAAKPSHPHEGAARRAEVAGGQAPFAIVLGCADSRIPPELVFDQGLGDLFVVRVAGHVVDEAALGSLEYGVEHLGASLLVVLGHECCGAVDAAVKGELAPGHIGRLVKALKPAVAEARTHKGDLLDEAVRANVHNVVLELSGSHPILQEAVKSHKLKIVGARYGLKDGRVEWIP